MYQSHTWSNKEAITVSRLNELEEGAVNAFPFCVTATYDSSTGVTALNKTWSEIYQALEEGNPAVILSPYSEDTWHQLYFNPIAYAGCGEESSTEYTTRGAMSNATVFYVGDNTGWIFYASTSTDYPTDSYNSGGDILDSYNSGGDILIT